jgi:hypothetical protein
VSRATLTLMSELALDDKKEDSALWKKMGKDGGGGSSMVKTEPRPPGPAPSKGPLAPKSPEDDEETASGAGPASALAEMYDGG